MSFKKATRKRVKLKIAITGPSGAGKTFSAMRLASGMGLKIAVADTENGSASLYSDKFNFDVLEITPPYTAKKYLDAIQAAEQGGYDVLIIDSYSHVWAGDGGLLAKKEAKDTAGGNSYTNWASITKEHEQLKAAILNANIHIVASLRSKQDYIMQENDKGKMAPVKVGLAPVQREGMEYEFTTVFDVSMSHYAQISKDRTGLFAGEIHQITEDTGKRFLSWLEGGELVPLAPPPKDPPQMEETRLPEDKPRPQVSPTGVSQVIHGQFNGSPSIINKPLSEPQIKRLHAIAGKAGVPAATVVSTVQARYGCLPSEMTKRQYDEICTQLEQSISTVPASTGGVSK